MNKKGVNEVAEKLIFIVLAIGVAVIVFIIISKTAPHLFDSLKDLV